MKQLILLSYVLAATLLTVSCEKENPNDPTSITGTGEIVNKPLEISSFSNIELNGVADLYISVGSEQSVILKAQQNIIDVMSWEVSAGTLSIGLKEGITIHNHKEIRFEIHLPALASLVHDGVGDVTLNGGNQPEMDIDFRGVGLVKAYGLPVDRCVVLNSGIGDCKVKVNSYLEVDISDLGNVYYKGNPEISVTDTGLGDLINDN
jgi:hypothetical protein